MRNKKETVIEKAHSIIDKGSVIEDKHDKLLKDWSKELNNCTTAKERAEINAKYMGLDSKYDKEEDKLYKKYYNLMHKEFGNIDLKDYKDLEYGFTDKKLVERLSSKRK